jgi:pimeloyl-ACP methyl ester carboxylesterase
MNLFLRNSRIKLSLGQIFWREIGTGSVLVFLHGSFRDSSQWLPLIEQLHKEYHCFAPDLLGFGESERPKDHYSIELEVECLAEFFEALHLPQVYLIGDSLGGWIAANYALKYPERVGGLVLLSPEGVSTTTSKFFSWQSRWLLGCPLVMLKLLRSLQPLLKLFGGGKTITRLWELRQQKAQFSTALELLFRRRPTEIQAELLNEKLVWLKTPTLILQGKANNLEAIAQSQVYASLAPVAKLQMIEGAGSNLAEELPDIVAQQVQAFLHHL